MANDPTPDFTTGGGPILSTTGAVMIGCGCLFRNFQAVVVGLGSGIRLRRSTDLVSTILTDSFCQSPFTHSDPTL
jgi:hypothetical protein